MGGQWVGYDRLLWWLRLTREGWWRREKIKEVGIRDVEQRSGGIWKKVSGGAEGSEGGEESMSGSQCRVEKDEVFNPLKRVRQGTDVQARGCRRNSSSSEKQSSSSDLNFGTLLSSWRHGTSQARRLTPHMSSHWTDTRTQALAAIASRILISLSDDCCSRLDGDKCLNLIQWIFETNQSCSQGTSRSSACSSSSLNRTCKGMISPLFSAYLWDC